MKYSSLSEIQKVKFKEISGMEFKEGKLQATFMTNNAYSNPEGKKHSPWIFSFVIEPNTGNLICELDHRMTNNRIHGWDRNGSELSDEIKHKYFTPHW